MPRRATAGSPTGGPSRTALDCHRKALSGLTSSFVPHPSMPPHNSITMPEIGGAQQPAPNPLSITPYGRYIEERLKDSKLGQALRHLPSGDEHANRVWMTAALAAVNLTAFCCDLCSTASAAVGPDTRPRRSPRQRRCAICSSASRCGSCAPPDSWSCAGRLSPRLDPPGHTRRDPRARALIPGAVPATDVEHPPTAPPAPR